jgi:hypothetical protein
MKRPGKRGFEIDARVSAISKSLPSGGMTRLSAHSPDGNSSFDYFVIQPDELI